VIAALFLANWLKHRELHAKRPQAQAHAKVVSVCELGWLRLLLKYRHYSAPG
jgi:hypothetical protein